MNSQVTFKISRVGIPAVAAGAVLLATSVPVIAAATAPSAPSSGSSGPSLSPPSSSGSTGGLTGGASGPGAPSRGSTLQAPPVGGAADVGRAGGTSTNNQDRSTPSLNGNTTNSLGDQTGTIPNTNNAANTSTGTTGSGTTGGSTVSGTSGGTTGGTISGTTGGASESTSLSLQGYVSITNALNEALIRSPRAAAIRALLDIQKSAYWAATEMKNPSYYRDEAPISEGILRNGVIRTWDPPWKIAFRLLAAKRQVREQKLELLNNLWTFRNEVRRAYLEVVMAQETYETISQLASLAARLQTVSEKLFRAGSVAELDVFKARLAASQSEVERDQGLARVQLAKRQLDIIMGRSPDLPIAIPTLAQFRLRAEKAGLLPNLSRPVPELDYYMNLAMANRLELRILDRQIELARAQMMNTVGNIIPDPQFATGSSWETNPPSGPKLYATFFTFNIELPVFDLNQGDISRLRATMRQYRAQILAQRNQVAAGVNNAYNHLMIARRKIAAYEDHILSDSEHVARLARRSYEVGQSDITSTLAAQQANVQVRQNYLDTVNAYQQAYTELEQSVGVPLI